MGRCDARCGTFIKEDEDHVERNLEYSDHHFGSGHLHHQCTEITGFTMAQASSDTEVVGDLLLSAFAAERRDVIRRERAIG